MESVTGAINRAIFGESTASDKPATTDVEDRQSYQRNDPAGSSVISDEPSSTPKFSKPESASPMRHETPNTSTTSYGAGGDSGFGTPSYETANKSGTAAAFPSTGASEFGKSSSVDTTDRPFSSTSESGNESRDTPILSTGRAEFENSTIGNQDKPFSSTGASEFGSSSVDNKPLSSTSRSDYPSNTNDKTLSETSLPNTRNDDPSFAKPGQFDNEPKTSYLDDASTMSLASGTKNIGSETPRGPTDNTFERDTADSPAAGAQGSNITGMKEGEERPNVSSANEPTAEVGAPRNNPAASTADPAPKGVTGATGSGPGTAVEPSVGADPSSGGQDKQKQQGADRPMDEPEGDASSSSAGPSPAPAGGAAGVQKESTGEGTGEKYEKSTGMAADGGDFDATRPGAGREADRLLEEKGIHHGVDQKPEEEEETGEGSTEHSAEGTGKVSTAQKIKEKLHIGHKK